MIILGMKNDIQNRNEYQLTDAFSVMINKGHIFKSFAIDACLDCGIPQTLLSTNRILLDRCGGNALHPSVKIDNSNLRHCTISENCLIENSHLENVIMLPGSRMNNYNLENAIVGFEEYLV